jgi:hypothetical protein
MKTWIFVGDSGCRALSKHRRGGRLPDRLGPWARTHFAILDCAIDNNLTAFRSLEAKGYFVMGYADPDLISIYEDAWMARLSGPALTPINTTHKGLEGLVGEWETGFKAILTSAFTWSSEHAPSKSYPAMISATRVVVSLAVAAASGALMKLMRLTLSGVKAGMLTSSAAKLSSALVLGAGLERSAAAGMPPYRHGMMHARVTS